MRRSGRSRQDQNREIVDRALKLIGSNSGGILQSELRKMLAIDSSKCSRIVSRLELQGHISRKRHSSGRSRTYLLRLTAGRSLGGDFLSRNIDSYLTEIYLLYLIRGASRQGEPPRFCR